MFPGEPCRRSSGIAVLGHEQDLSRIKGQSFSEPEPSHTTGFFLYFPSFLFFPHFSVFIPVDYQTCVAKYL